MSDEFGMHLIFNARKMLIILQGGSFIQHKSLNDTEAQSGLATPLMFHVALLTGE
jgi:hypothetical protein